MRKPIPHWPRLGRAPGPRPLRRDHRRPRPRPRAPARDLPSLPARLPPAARGAAPVRPLRQTAPLPGPL